MDLDHLQHLALGRTLTIEELTGLEHEFTKRINQENLDQLQFWGKIYGDEKDYLVAVGLQPGKLHPQKKFYYCTSTKFELQQFPVISDEVKSKLLQKPDRLRGDPSLSLDDVKDPADPSQTIREEHRLAATVLTIDHDVAVVPKNAYIVASNHQVVQNAVFKGLSAREATSLQSYFHFRPPTNELLKTTLEKQGLVRPTDFMDSLVDDRPKDIWAIQPQPNGKNVVLRNLMWPGSATFHILSTSKYGYAYFGDGRKNEDIAFML